MGGTSAGAGGNNFMIHVRNCSNIDCAPFPLGQSANIRLQGRQIQPGWLVFSQRVFNPNH